MASQKHVYNAQQVAGMLMNYVSNKINDSIASTKRFWNRREIVKKSNVLLLVNLNLQFRRGGGAGTGIGVRVSAQLVRSKNMMPVPRG